MTAEATKVKGNEALLLVSISPFLTDEDFRNAAAEQGASVYYLGNDRFAARIVNPDETDKKLDISSLA
ncbi:MAG: hypothetical protein UT00_C0033G0001 [Parcubacteria group bacterium GW2011_GWA1_38_7]|nr:MAG: hypothetical protein UT00_C0033G0001 [Parcubacteria group bacterium GW2011_GWA1_38_7]